MKQQLEEQTKPFQPSSPKRKVASTFTVKTSQPSQTIITPKPQIVDEVKPLTEKFDSFVDQPERLDRTFESSQAEAEKLAREIEGLCLQSPKPLVEEPVVEPVIINNSPQEESTQASNNVVEESTEDDAFESPLVYHLVSMGFDKSKVKKTISSGYADLESALNHLLDN
jgi:hypothetical protein